MAGCIAVREARSRMARPCEPAVWMSPGVSKLAPSPLHLQNPYESYRVTLHISGGVRTYYDDDVHPRPNALPCRIAHETHTYLHSRAMPPDMLPFAGGLTLPDCAVADGRLDACRARSGTLGVSHPSSPRLVDDEVLSTAAGER